MKTIEIAYNPYKLDTKIFIDGVDVCQCSSYDQFRKFIERKIPLQIWIEPIPYMDWSGFVNETSDPENNDAVKIIFSGRKIDYEDLKRSIRAQNASRSEDTRVRYDFQHKKVLDDKVLSQNIEEVVSELKSDRFRALVEQRKTQSLRQKYDKLDEAYTLAKENVFYIVFAGAYSAGKSTLLNALIRHDVLPTDSRTCTSKNCRIRHNRSLGNKVSLTCFDQDDHAVIPERIYETDVECAKAFMEICPVKGINSDYSNVVMMEIGADLSHLYPSSVSEDKFNIVLIDTPGMDSAKSSENGINRHAEIALDAISMENKPMIVLCADANYYDNKSIGEFMRAIIEQTQEDSGFNDRFLFLMNKSDMLPYKDDTTAEDQKREFAEYLTDSSRWNIRGEEGELQQLAEKASHFVPRVFMTASRVALAIQRKAFEFSDEELEDKDKDNLLETYENFEKKICGRRKRIDYYLSRYCDIPAYRKEEIESEFQTALAENDDVRATELQCGLVSVESAIRDYIERYAYPIKVRSLLNTFEDILADVNGFTEGVLADLDRAKKELGEKRSEREEVNGRIERENGKIAALEKARGRTEHQLSELDTITFDSVSLGRAISDFRADIDGDVDIRFIRSHNKVSTGQKTRPEVEREIEALTSRIQNLFDRTLGKINRTLENIKNKHDEQIRRIFNVLKEIVSELEQSGLFRQGQYNFTNSVLWKMYFSNINSGRFADDLKREVVDRTITTQSVRNWKKDDWASSWNPFKKIGSLFLDDYITTTVHEDGYYSTDLLVQNISRYMVTLGKESNRMEENFKDTMKKSKGKVLDMTKQLLRELEQFNHDIQEQQKQIEAIGHSITGLEDEIVKSQSTHEWLQMLQKKIEGV